jgi:hypothetical protein
MRVSNCPDGCPGFGPKHSHKPQDTFGQYVNWALVSQDPDPPEEDDDTQQDVDAWIKPSNVTRRLAVGFGLLGIA